MATIRIPRPRSTKVTDYRQKRQGQGLHTMGFYSPLPWTTASGRISRSGMAIEYWLGWSSETPDETRSCKHQDMRTLSVRSTGGSMEYGRYSVCMLSPMIHRRPNGHSENEDQVEACVYCALQTEYTLCEHAVRRSCHFDNERCTTMG